MPDKAKLGGLGGFSHFDVHTRARIRSIRSNPPNPPKSSFSPVWRKK